MTAGTNPAFDRLRQVADDHLLRYGGDFAPYFVTRAAGSYVYDQDGRAILDFCSGQMCSTLGHNHPAVVEAIGQGCAEAIHLFSGILAPPVVELAGELAALLPPPLSKVAFPNTGGESNEIALRLAKMYTGRFEIVALTGSWHGQTAGAGSVTYNGGRKGYGPTLPGSMALPAPYCYRCPVGLDKESCSMACLEMGFALIDAQSTGAAAAVIAEPIQSSGGVIVPPDGYFVRLREKCAERGMLLILDEAQTAFRVGGNFAFEALGVVPDILSLSKTLGGGVPLAASVTSAAIEEECLANGFMFYTSHISDPLPARVGLAVLRVLAEENLAERAVTIGTYLMEGLEALQQRHEAIGDVRGRGLLLGIELVEDRAQRQPNRKGAAAVLQRALELGLILNVVRTSGNNTLRLAPPLTIGRDEVDSGLEILDQALTECGL